MPLVKLHSGFRTTSFPTRLHITLTAAMANDERGIIPSFVRSHAQLFHMVLSPIVQSTLGNTLGSPSIAGQYLRRSDNRLMIRFNYQIIGSISLGTVQAKAAVAPHVINTTTTVLTWLRRELREPALRARLVLNGRRLRPLT